MFLLSFTYQEKNSIKKHFNQCIEFDLNTAQNTKKKDSPIIKTLQFGLFSYAMH